MTWWTLLASVTWPCYLLFDSALPSSWGERRVRMLLPCGSWQPHANGRSLGAERRRAPWCNSLPYTSLSSMTRQVTGQPWSPITLTGGWLAVFLYKKPNIMSSKLTILCRLYHVYIKMTNIEASNNIIKNKLLQCESQGVWIYIIKW